VTVGRAINFGVGTIVVALLALAGMFLNVSRTISESVEIISVQSNTATRAVHEMDKLLAKVHHEFTLFNSQNRHPRDTFPVTIERLNSRLESLAMSDPRIGEPVAAIAQTAASAATTWSEYFIETPWNRFSQESLDSTLDAVSKALYEIRKAFAAIAGRPDLEVPRRDLERTVRLIARCESLIERFRLFPDLHIAPMMKSVAQLRAIASAETTFSNARAAVSERSKALDAMARFEHALLLIADEGKNGFTSTTEVMASQVVDAHQSVVTAVNEVREAARSEIARVNAQAVEQVARSRQIAVAAVVACALVAIAFVIVLRRYLNGRLCGISKGVEAFTQGDLQARIPVANGDELGTLALAFNQMAETLARRVEERQRHIAEIETAHREAEAANAAKSQFLAAMSHEIRTPMNGVLGMAELLSTESLSPRQRDFVESIQNSGHTLLAVINDILDFSKIEAGHLDLDPQPFRLRPLVEEIGQLLAAGAHKKGLELAVVIDHALTDRYLGDAPRLRQILINLVGNAVKFTNEGKVTVRICIADRQRDSEKVRFDVVDTGVGIADGAQRRIFKPFAQVRDIARGTGGTGLGLSISDNLVAMMGGRLCLESVSGTGTTFWFEIPLATMNDESAANDPATPAVFRDLHVLVLSAQPDTQAGLEQQLLRLGIQHTMLASGREAFELLAQRLPSGVNVALVDSHLSDMDGIEFARSLQSEPGAIRADSVALSMVGEERTRSAAWKAANIHRHLPKPVSQSKLYDCLWELSGGRPTDSTSTRDEQLDAVEARPRFDACVLVAEDHPVNQQLATQMLERCGCRAVIAQHGARAVELLEAQNFDLVLMDCDMPVMDGFEATAEIRRKEHATGRPPACIVALTANAMQGDRERCLAAGMDDYLSKPFSGAQLNELLERHLDPVPSAGAGAVEVSPVTDPPAVAEYDDGDPVLDEQSLASIEGFGEDFVSSLLDAFVENATQDLERLRRAVDAEDAESARQAAHRMKSSSANIGARRLSARCADIEKAARNGNVDVLVELLATLEAEYHKALGAFESKQLRVA
jgi:signal transduction histidine kinase/DNA-binding response OmpR family regulator